MNFKHLLEQHPIAITVVASLVLLLIILVPVFIPIWRNRKLLKYGWPATAKVISHKVSRLKIGKHAGSEFMQGVLLELLVNPDSTDSYPVKSRSVIHISDFARIYPDMLVTVRVDPKNRHKVLIEHWRVD